MKLHTIGIDLGKTDFHLVGLSQTGEVVVQKKFSRTQLLRFTANVRVDLAIDPYHEDFLDGDKATAASPVSTRKTNVSCRYNRTAESVWLR